MVQLPTVPESNTHDAFVATPLGDYELIDFGHGRKLERWGPYLVEHPDRLAQGEPRDAHWQADWIYVAEVGQQGQEDAYYSGHKREPSQRNQRGVAEMCLYRDFFSRGIHASFMPIS